MVERVHTRQHSAPSGSHHSRTNFAFEQVLWIAASASRGRFALADGEKRRQPRAGCASWLHMMVCDEFSIGLLKTCLQYAPVALLKPQDYQARANLMWASTMALNGLIAAGKVSDWASHQMEHGVSAVSDITHGVGLAIILPAWMDFVLAKGAPKRRFEELGTQLFALEGDKIAERFVLMLKEFFVSLGMPNRLSQVGIKKEDLQAMAQKTMLSQKSIGGFFELNQDDVLQILQAAF